MSRWSQRRAGGGVIGLAVEEVDEHNTGWVEEGAR
jgi:hypothetical protein